MLASTALLLIAIPAPAASAAVDRSVGAACPLEGSLVIGDVPCATLAIESSWSCVGDGCTVRLDLTFSVPGGHCLQGGIQGSAYHNVCAEPGYTWRQSYSYGGYDEGQSTAFAAYLCVDGAPSHAGEWDTECAHWMHVTSPAPTNGAPDADDAQQAAEAWDEYGYWSGEAGRQCTPTLQTCSTYTLGAGIGTSPFLP